MTNKTLLVFLFIIGFSGSWTLASYSKAMQTPVVTGNVTAVEILKGDSFNVITSKLLAAKVTVSPLWFKLTAVSKQVINKIKTGEYELNPGLTMPQLLDILVQGKVKHYAITFPEGRNFKELRFVIESNPSLEHTLNYQDINSLMQKLGARETHPEGLFFPDTYFFEKHTTDFDILKRAYSKMQQVLQQEWQGKAAQLAVQTPYQALILASIIEKETAAPSERAQIAAVFTRRLQTNMLLQTDPTVIYGMGDNYHGNISSQDLITPTPYNTYSVKGLPPTPIAMPGRAAIHAALHPDSNPYLYFVAKGDGTHHFSATLEEHNAAVNTYQRKKP